MARRNSRRNFHRFLLRKCYFGDWFADRIPLQSRFKEVQKVAVEGVLCLAGIAQHCPLGFLTANASSACWTALRISCQGDSLQQHFPTTGDARECCVNLSFGSMITFVVQRLGNQSSLIFVSISRFREA